MTNESVFAKQEGLEFLSGIESNSVDLILVDPPYITSRDSGMDRWVKWVEQQDKPGSKPAKTEKEWTNHLLKKVKLSQWFRDFPFEVSKKLSIYKERKQNYLKYGSMYGKKYAVKTDYGEWDSEFTLESLAEFGNEFYRVLKKGGSCIVFFDLWKITDLKNILEKSRFKQLRFIEWVKTNPQPINSKRNYLTNCREIAVTAVKVGSSTFNSSYDNGIYKYPIYSGKDRFHPTQKSLPLFEDLIKKHSNPGDTVLDCFMGSGTTAVAAINTGRKYIGCEMNDEYYKKSLDRIEKAHKAKEEEMSRKDKQEEG
jgi:site-specific DNA-methyltransferase (adenine-specific)